jgi:hypothetical protein
MILVDITKALNTDFGKILLAAVALIFYSLLKTDFVKKTTTKYLDIFLYKIKGGKRKTVSEQSMEVSENDILHHDIFNYMTVWIETNIPNMTFFTEFRTIAFRKYLIIFFETYQSKLLEFIKDPAYKKMSNPELKQTLIKLLTHIIQEYELEMKKQGLPDAIINKMRNKNNETLNLIMELINSICNSNFYNTEDNLLKIYSFLNILFAILENIVINADIVCNSINGELKGMIIDGVQEPKHK